MSGLSFILRRCGKGGPKRAEASRPGGRLRAGGLALLEAERYEQLERGSVLFFSQTPFTLSNEEKEFLRTTGQSGSSYHKNIAYRPGPDKLTGLDGSTVRDLEKLHAIMRHYSQRVIQFLREFLPRYMETCRIDFASFRPQEEEGRPLPLTKRNDLLHIDAFPTRPTQGDLILRVFTNINPAKPRIWLISDPFEDLARRYAVSAGLLRIAANSASPAGRMASVLKRALRATGLPVTNRSSYDRFMLAFHDYLKRNEEYQQMCPKYRLEFPPDSTWIVFTDIVPHAVLSGQYALEQTAIVRRDRLKSPEKAPVAILESICKRQLCN